MAAINFPRATLVELHDRMRELLDAKKAGRTILAIHGQIGAALDKAGDPVPLSEPESGWDFLCVFAFGFCHGAWAVVDKAVHGVPA